MGSGFNAGRGLYELVKMLVQGNIYRKKRETLYVVGRVEIVFDTTARWRDHYNIVMFR
jgi:hypothetical protein